jgi:hypothetical protein
MQMPHADRAFVPGAKLHDYLLSESHPDGASKARRLRGLGFDDTNADLLAEQLRTIARTNSVDQMEQRPYGMLYVVHGIVTVPVGAGTRLRTVWIVQTGGDRPRFVTAYPART